jgi:phage I-like protein
MEYGASAPYGGFMKILIIDDARGLGREVALALNSQAQGSVGIALNFELAVGEPPTEMMLIPPGENVQGRDGRAWKNTAPQGIVDYFTVRGVDLPIDVEHATELKAPQGEPAPAAAWIKGLEVREGGAIYGRIEWTPGGRDMVLNREYRYYSPVLIYEKESGIIRGLSSVGLTNKPNLTVTALNHEQTKEKHMNLVALLAALGLPATHTFDQALNHITTLRSDYATALNRAETPDLAKFVPRAQFDAAVAKANNAEKGLKELKTAETEKAINSEIDAALKAGKIVPATKEFYIGMCRQEGGLESFRQFVAAAPVIAGDTDLDSTPPETTGKALNAAQKEVCAAMGMTEDDYLKAL